MFKDTKEGQTHSFNDGCGEPEHNHMTNEKPWWENEFEEKFIYFIKIPNGKIVSRIPVDSYESIKEFIKQVDQRAREEAYEEGRMSNENQMCVHHGSIREEAVKEFAERVVKELENRKEKLPPILWRDEHEINFEKETLNNALDYIISIIKEETEQT